MFLVPGGEKMEKCLTCALMMQNESMLCSDLMENL